MTNPDCAPEPTFDTIWAAGNVVDEVVVNPITMESPCAEPEGFTVRSGATAPLNTHRLASLTVPDWAIDGVVGLLTSTSYHRNSVLFPLATACSSRPSNVSSRLLVPFWGAFAAGGAYTGTVTDLPVTSICGTVGFPGVGRTGWTVITLPVPQMSGHSMSEEVITKPTLEGSSWMAGTGVKAWLPSWFRRLVNLPVLKLLDGGQVVMGPLPCGLSIHRRSDRSACRLDPLG